MMQRVQPSILLLLLLLGFTSCEKVIDVDLTETPPQLVIEAELALDQETFDVTISRSGSYFDTTPLEKIGSASVTLFNTAGLELSVPHVGNGLYRVEYTPEVSQTYTLSVTVEGATYTAVSTLLPPVELVELETEFIEENAFVDEGYFVYSRFLDEEDPENYYRFIHSINGEEQRKGENLQVINDRFIEGGLARVPIFGTTFLSGDTITIELLHIDKAAFDYFDSLADIIGDGQGPNGNSAAPGNPTTNWVGGDVLGYFAATSSDQLSVVLP